MTTIVALVPDLMDQSRLSAAATGPIEFVRSIDSTRLVEADLVVVDLARVDDLSAVRRAAPHSRIVAFGPHVDDAALAAARQVGIDDVMPRSKFFRQINELLG
jgi:hypothetical protein